MIKDESLVKETNVFNILSISSVKTIMKSVYYELIAEEPLVQFGRGRGREKHGWLPEGATTEQHLRDNRIWVKKGSMRRAS